MVLCTALISHWCFKEMKLRLQTATRVPVPVFSCIAKSCQSFACCIAGADRIVLTRGQKVRRWRRFLRLQVLPFFLSFPVSPFGLAVRR